MICSNCQSEVRGAFCPQCGAAAGSSHAQDEPAQPGDPAATALIRAEDVRQAAVRSTQELSIEAVRRAGAGIGTAEEETHFRSRSAFQIFNACLPVYLSNFRLFAGITFVLAIPQAILATVLYLVKVPGISSLVLTILFTPLATGVLALAITLRFLDRPASVARVYAAIGLSLFGVLVAASILLTIFISVGLILVIVPGIYLLVRFLFVPQFLVLEKTTVREAFARSSHLVQGTWWRVFGTYILVNLPAIPGIALVGLLSLLLGALWGAKAASIVLLLAPTLFVPTLIWPIPLTALTMLYYDLRVRKEGFGRERATASIS